MFSSHYYDMFVYIIMYRSLASPETYLIAHCTQEQRDSFHFLILKIKLPIL